MKELILNDVQTDELIEALKDKITYHQGKINEYNELIKQMRTQQTGTNTLVSGSVCKCAEPILQMTNRGMYCLRCETPIKQTDR